MAAAVAGMLWTAVQGNAPENSQDPPGGTAQQGRGADPQRGGAGRQGGGQRANFPQQQRAPGDPALIARGRALFGVHCAACHGVDLRGGDQGGPNLLRSQIILTDQHGENMLPVIRDGRQGAVGTMPAFRLPEPDILAIAEYIHSVMGQAGRQGRPPERDTPVELNVILQVGAAKRASLNGARLQAAEQLRSEVATLVFTPDRLVVVKGGPAARRAYFDRALGRGTPTQAALPAEYGAALAQRNASLRGISLGYSTREALRPWTERVAELGAQLVAARREVISALEPLFAARAGELGLADAALRYEAASPSVESLEARLDRDLDRGATGAGPHLDDVEILAGTRDLRAFGSQGEQRLAVLALLLAEAELVRERRGVPPLLLLDDVLSELDPERRRTLAERLPAYGQALITTTSATALPVEPNQLVEVEAGEAGTVLR